MKNRDFSSLAISVLLHAIIFIAVLNIPVDLDRDNRPEQFIEVIMGGDEITETDFLPVPEANAADAMEEEAPPPPQQESQERETQTRQSRPVRTPTQQQPVRSNERISTPPSEQVDPRTPPTEGTTEPTRTNPETSQTSSGQTAGTASQTNTSTSENTNDSSSSTSTASSGSPRSGFQIIGINRRVVRRNIPRHTQLVNSTIDVCISVDPQGNVVGKYICRKGNATLEQESLRAVSAWKFSALPQGAPQVNQNGRIRFVFVVE